MGYTNTLFGEKPTKLVSSTYHFKSLWVQLCYFTVVSIVGYLFLKLFNPRSPGYEIDDVDLFFTAVSAATVSSMATVEMEVFSSGQLMVITVLMFLGSEICTSFIDILIQIFKPSSPQDTLQNFHRPKIQYSLEVNIELGTIALPKSKPFSNEETESQLHYNSVKTLGYVILGYILTIHAVGLGLISTYIILNPSANNVLENKGLNLPIFSVFTTVSTFTNCGFLPTNENMMVFQKNSGFLLILIPLILLGNTLYPPCLRFIIHTLHRITKKKEFQHILDNHQELGYAHLMSSQRSWYLLGTFFMFLLVQFVAFLAMEWNSKVMEGMNSFQKVVGSLFECVNSRHAGESIFDLASVSSAILVLFVVMMYLPPYTSFLPIGYHQEEASENKGTKGEIKKKKKKIDNIILSPLCYLVIFVLVVCITENKSIKEDPLNFSLLNLVLEVVSAYGNVGLSTGYSCARRLKLDGNCEDKWFGLVGRWSNPGKLVLILVMFFGKLKKFNINGGKAWIIL